MNILVYSHIALWTIHHAETVEIVLKHLAEGNNVYLLSCDGDLVSCPANPHHDQSLCSSCKHQTNYTLKKILKNKVHDLRISLSQEKIKCPVFTDLDELSEFKLFNVPFGELVVSQLVDDEKDCFFPLDDKYSKISKLLSNSISLYKNALHTIKNKKIDKVYVWNGRRSSDGPVCYAAKDAGISLEVYISASKKGAYVTLPALKVHDLATNKIFMDKVYDEAINKNGINLVKEEAITFFNNQRYGGADYPGFVHFAEKFHDIPKVTTDVRKKIVIFPGSYWESFGMPDYRSGCYVNHYDGIKRILGEEKIISEYILIVRWHPNLQKCGHSERKIIDQIIKEFTKSATHYEPESDVDSYKLLDMADIVITFGSTIGIEANFYGKPSILLGRSLYEDLDACYTVKSHEELVHLLSGDDLLPLPKNGSIKYGFYWRARGQNFSYLRQLDSWNFEYNGQPLQATPQMSFLSFVKFHITKILKFTKIHQFIKSILIPKNE